MKINSICGCRPTKEGYKAFFEEYFKQKITEYPKELQPVGVYFNLTSSSCGSYATAVVRGEAGYLFVDGDLRVLNGPFDTATPLHVGFYDQITHAAKKHKKDWLSVVRAARRDITKLETSTFGTTEPVYVGRYAYADACLVKKDKLCGIVDMRGRTVVPTEYVSIYPFCFLTEKSASDFFEISEGETSLYLCYTGSGDVTDVYDTAGNLIFKGADPFTANKMVVECLNYKTSMLSTKTVVESVRVRLGGRTHVFSVDDMRRGNVSKELMLHKVEIPFRTLGRRFDFNAAKGEFTEETVNMLRGFARLVGTAHGLSEDETMSCICRYDTFLKAAKMKDKLTKDTATKATELSAGLCEKLCEKGLKTAGDIMLLSDKDIDLLNRAHSFSDKDIEELRDFRLLMNMLYLGRDIPH